LNRDAKKIIRPRAEGPNWPKEKKTFLGRLGGGLLAGEEKKF